MSQKPGQDDAIDRREAIKRVSALLGGATLIGGTALLTRCTSDRAPAVTGVGDFTAADVALLDEIAETILPETDTPGAKAAQVGAFMALMVTDSYKPEDQTIFRTGMRQLDEGSTTASNDPFMSATPAARLSLLEALDREQKAYHDDKDEDAPDHYFRMMKQLALLGYFTSEIGYMRAQRYVESPGKFEPCVPYTIGERSWAPHA